MTAGLRIGDLARSTGTTVETIRYYERIGLLKKPGRSDGNYRVYGSDGLKRLNFIRHARGLGFEIAGRLPGAFRHPALGFVDALVMFRALEG